MRVVKLSKSDEEMRTPQKVRNFFEKALASMTPPGQFLMTKGRIPKIGLRRGEKLVFSYHGEIVYLGVAASEDKYIRASSFGYRLSTLVSS